MDEKKEKVKTFTVAIVFKNNPVPLIIPGVEKFDWTKLDNRITKLEWTISPDRGLFNLDFIRLDEIVAITSTDDNTGLVN
jgi:hypothetical protein